MISNSPYLINSKTILIGGLLCFTLACTKKESTSEIPTITVDDYTFQDLNQNGKLDPYEDTRLSLEERASDLESRLTEDEKANLLVGGGMPGFNPETWQFNTNDPDVKVPGAAGRINAIPRLGLPKVILADGPAGLRIIPIRGNDSITTYYATAFPVGTALASSWNTDLVKSVGEAMGNEVKEYGVDVLLAPGMNIHRNPLNGRNFEYYSEDPILSGTIAAAMVNGIQSNGVGTSIKHFVANNQERNRMGVNAHISERAMREIYLRGFEIAVKKAQPWTVMSSYNKVDGTYTSERKDLLTTILRDEWGFKGTVMTDWMGGYESFMAARTDTSDVAAQLKAGNDLLMPGNSGQKAALLSDLKSGELTQETVNTDLKRVLELILRSPSMDRYEYSDKPDLKSHAIIARNAGAEATVLLKNDGNTLPFTDKSAPLAVFGNTSYNFIAGGTGSGDVNEAYTVPLIDGLTNAGFGLDQSLTNVYEPYVKAQKEKEAERRKKEGLLSVPQRMPELKLDQSLVNDMAKKSGIALITLGRNSGESGDRNVDDDFNLAQDEQDLINMVSKAFHAENKKVVVILNIGGVVETASWRDKVDAILLPWQGVQEAGNAVADVFTGKVNPSGKLTMTFPVNYEDAIATENWIGTPEDNPTSVSYKEGIYVGYRYFNTAGVKPSYPFGYGLSYTDFEYSDAKLSSNTFNDMMTISVTVKNTGNTAGKDVVELYLGAPNKMIDKPKEELKAFAKTKELQPGESQTLTLMLHPKDLASFIP